MSVPITAGAVLYETLEQRVDARTAQPLKTIEDALERDYFLTADSAKDFGLVDKVFETRPDNEETGQEDGSGGAPE